MDSNMNSMLLKKSYDRFVRLMFVIYAALNCPDSLIRKRQLCRNNEILNMNNLFCSENKIPSESKITKSKNSNSHVFPKPNFDGNIETATVEIIKIHTNKVLYKKHQGEALEAVLGPLKQVCFIFILYI